MKNRYFLIGVSVLFLFSALTAAQAEMIKVNLNVVAERGYPNGGPATSVCFGVLPIDSAMSNPPDYVESIVATAPNGDTFEMKDNWFPYFNAYILNVPSESFTGGTAPSGTYKVSVKDTSGKTITSTDALSIKFLDEVTITQPVPGATEIGDEYVIKWNRVPGAKQYSIGLWNNSWNLPVILDIPGPWVVYTQNAYYRLPKGMLRPNCNYRVRIVAIYDLQDSDRRSWSNWVTFTSAAW
jgi:hypothetical protein